MILLLLASDEVNNYVLHADIGSGEETDESDEENKAIFPNLVIESSGFRPECDHVDHRWSHQC